MKKFLAVMLGGLLMANVSNIASAEVRTYEGVGEYVMSDFETPDIAKQRAKARAEAAAQEKAGVLVKSNTQVVNLQLKSEEIEIITSGVMKVHSVTYDVKPDSSGFVFMSKVVVDIDTDEIDKWLNQNENSMAELVAQNKALQNSIAEQEKQLAELKAKLAAAEKNQSETSVSVRIQMTRDFAQNDSQFLSNQRLKVGNDFYSRKDYNSAISAYTEAIELNPQNIDAYIYRGGAFGYLKNYQSAAADFSNAIQIDNRNFNAHYGLGTAYLYQRNYQAAISELDIAISLDSQNAAAYYARGYCYEMTRKNFESQRDYETARRLGYQF